MSDVVDDGAARRCRCGFCDRRFPGEAVDAGAALGVRQSHEAGWEGSALALDL